MRHRIIIAVMIAAVPLIVLSGCKEPEEPPKTEAPPPDPGWPTLSLQDAAIEYDLEEAHYHIRKARYTAPDSYGSEFAMPAAMG